MSTFSLIHFWIQRPRRLYFGDFTAQLAWNILGTEKNSKSKRRLSNFQPQIPLVGNGHIDYRSNYVFPERALELAFVLSSHLLAFSLAQYISCFNKKCQRRSDIIQHSFQVINVTMCILHA